MQFGVQFFPNFQPKDKSPKDYFAESLAIAEEAEALGYSHARSVEHYFERYGGYSPNPIIFPRGRGGAHQDACGSSPAPWCRPSTIR